MVSCGIGKYKILSYRSPLCFLASSPLLRFPIFLLSQESRWDFAKQSGGENSKKRGVRKSYSSRRFPN
ncbi:MAG: hypothetical protein COZ37_01970 [bacterium (Candidatus Ratteibacteria) CG_4_10_14_3_um_filter_41_18]|uniref:Uncharacterized protein n=3 Tax=Candidatus Ratteibacteria TaxID=2979319 RepID=A0A2M7YHR3_9BACT|nr:MAG: hypothetical protein AUJ76_00265 [Candidatus Omnitrophica bacterium CG1_02_41_171]PIV64673.1 MAG: hypothetical protein COS11_00935 [bacterium (Candidatus Ratteibacteria) CG01_land_8_20_14_3_00_40_19]PIX77581.1 MAG: hypothetical protein COZ37_01970 [bacterium (Candidatus Ratteibacteria) CG_4_10_14_3_um_filter_41_18]PJA62514.1 MAG: hypothetical protein CO162_00680 [bacterium (Candidatus Ratteibacteria) CG_4_9_14_3_um_filter_41_21]